MLAFFGQLPEYAVDRSLLDLCMETRCWFNNVNVKYYENHRKKKFYFTTSDEAKPGTLAFNPSNKNFPDNNSL